MNVIRTFTEPIANLKNVKMNALKAYAIKPLENASVKKIGPKTTVLSKHVQTNVTITEYARAENVSAMMGLKANTAKLQFVKIIATIKDFASKEDAIA